MKRKLLTIFFPPKCVFCGKVMGGSGVEICPDCMEHKNILKVLPVVPPQMYVDEQVFAAWYLDHIRYSIHRFKFQRKAGYGRAYAFLLYRHFLLSNHSYDMVSWVPSNRHTVYVRGYNQAQVLAEELAKLCGLPCVETMKKTRRTQAMYKLTPSQRRANVLGAFQVCSDQVEGKSILLVDDIYTTGATINECARMLKLAKCRHLGCYTFARKKQKIVVEICG